MVKNISKRYIVNELKSSFRKNEDMVTVEEKVVSKKNKQDKTVNNNNKNEEITKSDE